MPTRRSDTMRAVDAVMPLVDEFNLLDEGDKLTFLDLVDPLPEKHDHRPKKKASKKSSKSQSSSKSPRASGIHAQLKERREAATKDITGESKEPDIFGAIAERRLQTCTTCGGYEEYMDHHKPSPNYHPFVPATTAPPAPAPSSANGGAANGAANSGTGKVDAGTVAHGASGGD